MKNKTKASNNDYENWFSDNWMKSGGLITPSTAAKILNVKMPTITQTWKRKGLKKYIFSKNGKSDLPLLSLTDVMDLKHGTKIHTQTKNYLMNELKKELTQFAENLKSSK